MSEVQKKFRYSANIILNGSGTSFTDIEIQEFTPPSRRSEPLRRFSRAMGGEVHLTGPVSHGELTIRVSLINTEGGNPHAALIKELQDMKDLDIDTCNIVVSMLDGVGGGGGRVAYKHEYSNCRLTGISFDALNRRGEDDHVHADITLQPTYSERLLGSQISGA